MPLDDDLTGEVISANGQATPTPTDDDERFDSSSLDRGDQLNEPEPEPEPEPTPAPKDDDEPEHGIPKARFDQVNERRKQAEAELVQLRAELEQRGAPKEAAPAPTTVDIDAKEQEYLDALLEGETAKAVQIRKEINAELKRQAAEEVEVAQAARTEKARVDAAATAAIEQYPFLDSQSDAANKEAIAEVVEWRDFYQAKGMPLSVALAKAVEKVGPTYAGAAKPAVQTPPADTRKKESIERGMQASKAQPPVQRGIGERASQPGRVDVANMSDEEYDALPESEKRRLRGD
jgi:hypothetical protein